MPAVPATTVPRAFGQAQDLDLDFDGRDRPALVTALLARCVPPLDGGHWWAQPVGARTAALLQLLQATTGEPAVELASRCGAEGCATVFEFELPLVPLAALDGGDGPVEVGLEDGRSLALRRPTGEDLRRWRDRPAAGDPRCAMLEQLCLQGRPRAEDLERVAAALAEHDPLVDFTVGCTCPACGQAVEVVLDLEALALRRLHQRQRELLREVHAFARHYGWTEAETLAVPAARRARYLALIEASA